VRGVSAVMKKNKGLLPKSALPRSGTTVGVFEPMLPLQLAGSSTAIPRGNSAPSGAVLKISAASPHVLVQCGPVLVCARIEDFIAASNDPDCDVTANTVLIVRNSCPTGSPGFSGMGNMPLPK
jgi:dihydroxy-acid dehydratase